VPTSKSHIFTTVKDNQTSVKILVLQGESERAEENELLGEFILTGLRPAPKGEVEIEVTFEINADGIVSVSAKDLETGQQQAITVTATSGLTEDEIKHMMEENREYLVDVRTNEELEMHRVSIQRSVMEIDRIFPKVRTVLEGSDFGQEAIRKAEGVLERARRALDGNDVASLKTANEQLSRTLNMFRGVVQKIG
jgi:molecular chaperone DnaK